MFRNDEIKNQVQQLNDIESNSKCFDCDSYPAHWVSLKDGIFLCFNCAEEHKKFDISTKSIKSTTLDNWTKEQLNIIKKGGNKKLLEFLNEKEVPSDIGKAKLYNSKLMNYYRQKLKFESKNEIFNGQLPLKEEYWDSILDINIDSLNIFKNSSKNLEIDNNNNLICGGNMIELPQNSIMIDEDQYNIAKEKKILELKQENSVLKKNNTISSNDPRFSQISMNNKLNNNSDNNNSFSTFGSIFNTIWDTGKTATISVTNKIKEYRVGAAIFYVGEKLYIGVSYVGGKLIGAGSVVMNSETTHNIVSRAGEGFVFLKNKIAGNNEENVGELEKMENNYMLNNCDDARSV